MRYIWGNTTLGLKYYTNINDASLSDQLRQASIKTDNCLMDFYVSSWQDFPDIGRITGAYIIFYQGGPIYHGKHVPGPVAKSSTESEYNVACTAGMSLEHLRILTHEFLNKYPDIVPEEAPLIFLDSKSDICMAKNGKDTKHTRHISKRMHFIINGEKCKLHKIDWCEGGLQLAYIATKNIGETDLTSKMKYILIILDN